MQRIMCLLAFILISLIGHALCSADLNFCSESVKDGSFETSILSHAPDTNRFWGESSSTFGTPVCDSSCGDGVGTAGPRTGSTWVWFGGAPSGPEPATVNQYVAIPDDSYATLSFYVWNGLGSGDPADYFRVFLDDTLVLNVTGGSNLSAQFGAGYTLVTIDLSSFGGPGEHKLLFKGYQNTSTTNISLDDVSLTTCPLPPAASVAIDPLGRFAVYTGTPEGCDVQVPFYQAINSTGDPLGDPIQLVGCGVVPGSVNGIDILREENSDLYWLSFVGSDSASPRFLMQLDAPGNIVAEPKAVVPAGQFGTAAGATAIAPKGCCWISMWMTGSHNNVYRAIIDKESRTLQSARKTDIKAGIYSSLQVTQHGSRFFLAAEKPEEVFRGFGLDGKGVLDGSVWRICPRTTNGHQTGAVSSDGLMALSNDSDPASDQLYAQPLSSDGTPAGNPSVITSSSIIDVFAEDVSDPLADDKRFVVYAADAGDGMQVFLQAIHAGTGIRIGPRILLNP